MKSSPFSLTTLWTITGAVATLAVFSPLEADAQFHEKRGDQVVPRTQIPTGTQGPSSRPQASYKNLSTAEATALAARQSNGSSSVDLISSTRPTATSTSASGTQPLASNRTATVSGSQPPPVHDVEAKWFRDGISRQAWEVKIVQQQGGEAEIVWGRVKHHPNGNYTISKVDKATLYQRTFTPPRTAEEHYKTDDERHPIERRVVQLNAAGKPAEVLIYDTRDQLKFRGVLVYDNITGKFLEEQLINPSNQIVRRRVQKYDQAGRALPIKTYMDEDAIHGDTSLVLTGQESPTGFTGSATQAAGEKEEKQDKSLLRRMMFWKD